jgi:PAS domain S-box-containing protein
MKDQSSIPKQSLTTQIEQAALQNDKQTMVGLIHLIVFTTSITGGSVMYFYDMNSYLSLILLGFASVFGWILNRAGHTRSSAVILIASLLIIIQFNIFAGYGIHDVAIIAWPAFIFFSGLLFGWRVIPYITTIILGLAIATKIIPNDPFFFDYSDTGDLIVMLLILLAFSIIAIALLRGNEHLIQHLQQSDERFKAIYNSINDAIFIHDAQTGAILDVNARMLDMFGYTHREAILLDFLAISSGIPPYTQQNALERIKKTVAEGTQQFEWQVKDKSGRLFWVDVNMKYATIAEQSQVLVSVRDITERKQADENLARLNQKTELILNAAAEGILGLDLQGNHTFVNPIAAKMLGYEVSELLGCPSHSTWHHTKPDGSPYPREECAIYAAYQDGAVHRSSNEVFWRKDGTSFPIEYASTPIYEQGRVVGAVVMFTDITERKRAEEQVRNSEKRFHALIEHGRDNISLLAADGTLLWESPSADSTLGYAPNQFVGHNIFELMHPDDQAWTSNMYAQVVQSPGNIQEGVFRLLHANGMWRWIECSATNLLNEPSVQAIVLNYRDITVRKRAEEALRESEERYRTLFQQASDGIFYLSTKGEVLAVNESFARMHGYSVEEMQGMSLQDLDTPKNVQQIPERMRRIMAGEVIEFEAEHYHKDGHIFPLAVSTALIAVGGESIIQAFHRDITERRHAEQALMDSEEKYRGLVQGSPDAIVIYVDGKIVFANPASAELMRASNADDLLGRAVIELIHPDYREFVTRRMIAAREEGKTLPLAEEKFIRLDGTAVDVEVKAIPITFKKKSAVQIIARDITERKQRENELQAIATLSAALRTAPTRAEMLPVIVEQLVILLDCETVSVEIIDSLTGDTVLEVAHGGWKSLIGTRQKSGTGINAIISQTRQPYTTNDLKHDPNVAYPEWIYEDIRGGIGAPLIAQEQLIGFLWIGRKNEIAKSEVRLLAAVADIAANAIHRATLHERTQKDAAALALAYDTTLEGWAHALELRDHETEGHSRNVVRLTLDLARAMGIAEGELEHVRRGALLHDIGKMGIPDSVLLKPGTLNEREWEIMRQHPEYAYKLLEPIEYLRPVLDIPYCHHEKWDGSGYPRNLKGDEIPLAARIFAIVDVWDALMSDRPYRLAWSQEKALEHIAKQSGRHFDPAVVDAFLKII